MSMELFVVTSGGKLPARAQIEQDAASQGITLAVDPFEWEEQAGFLPMVLNGKKAGVEIDLASVDQLVDEVDILLSFGIGGDDPAVVFRWSTNMRECACAYIVAGALARLCKGRIIDPQVGEEISAEEAAKEAKDALALAK